MKEIILILQAIFTGFIAPPHNILDLSNLYIHPQSQMAHTMEPIEVEVGMTYTLVIDEMSLGQHLDYIKDYEIEIESQYYDFYAYQFDDVYRRAYVSFTAKDTSIHIHQIPASFYGHYEIMLYQGSYDAFVDFEYLQDPYLKEYIIPVDNMNSAIISQTPFVGDQVIKIAETESLPKYQLFKHKQAPHYYLVLFEYFDRTAPSIYGPSEIMVYQSQVPLSNEAILGYFNISDNASFEVSIITNNYNQTQIPGRYQVKIQAVDASSNIATYITYINVIGDEIDEVELQVYMIETSIFETLSLEDIYDIIDAYLNQLNMPYDDLDIVLNTYARSKSTPGNYEIYYDVSINNETYEGVMQIQVNHPLEEKSIQYGLYATAGIFAGILYFSVKKRLKKNR